MLDMLKILKNVDADIISNTIDQRDEKSYRGIYLFSLKEEAKKFFIQ